MSTTQTDSSPPGSDALRFTELWETCAARVLAYALRHTDPDIAQEIVSETFLVAWRRITDVPGDPLPWLLVVARNTVKNQRRSGYRRAVMQHEISRLREVATPAPGVDEVVTERADVLAALSALTSKEREALLLVAWDGLSPADAARVADCSIATFQVRLYRARRRLQGHQSASEASEPLSVLNPRSTS